MRKANLCVVVPAYNEEKVIESALIALKRIVNKKNIYIVSDGSTDRTAQIAKLYCPNIMRLKKNIGKASALQRLIKSRNLIKRYKYVLFSDADSRLSPDFLKQIRRSITFNPACIVSTVTSDRLGLVSAFRTYEYGLTHKIFKKAQDILQVITVAPGCASLYRSDVLAKLNFSQRTLTEDFDLTIQIHQKKLGRIIYVPLAKVITQDPPTIKNYWYQITRWYTGFWQNIFLHQLYKPTSKLNLEIYVLVLDSFAWFASVAFAIINPTLFLRLLLLTYATLMVLAITIISFERQFWALFYVPLFPFIYFMNLSAYTFSFFRALFGRNRAFSWNKVARYKTASTS